MDRRIHEALDGDRARRELTDAERARLDEYERAIEEALAPLAREEGIDVTASVMSRIREVPAPGAARVGGERIAASAPPEQGTVSTPVRRAWEWLWRPREVRVRPAWVMAAAAAAVVALLGPLDPTGDPGPSATGAVTGAAPLTSAVNDGPAHGAILVQFRLDAADASSVRLAGDFTGWQPAHALNEVAPGVWSVVVALEPGVHDYAFVVDGEHWRPDPLAPAVDDGFGGTNSRLALLPPEREAEPRGTS